MDKTGMLQIVLGLIAAYHVLMGLGAMFSDQVAARLAWSVFGLRLEMTPQSSYLVKIIGIYAAVFGAVVGVIATEPARYTPLLMVIVALYVLRIGAKIAYRKTYVEVFQASETRVWTDAAMLAVFGVLVLLLRPS